MKRKSFVLTCLLLSFLFLFSCSYNPPKEAEQSEETTSTQVFREEITGDGSMIHYTVIYPEDYDKYRDFPLFAEPDVLNIFEYDLDRVAAVGVDPEKRAVLPTDTFEYRFCTNQDQSGYEIWFWPSTKEFPYITLEEALRDREFFEQYIQGFEHCRASQAVENYVQIGNALYSFWVWGGIRQIIIYVNETWVVITPFNVVIDQSPHINSPVWDRLIDPGTAPEQIDQIIAAWEGKW